MTEIIIDGVSVDMFPDTKVSGSYQPIDFTSENTFKLPYTNSFTIPLTEKNRIALGFDKVLNEFTKEKLIGQVVVDGKTLFYGIVYIDTVEFEVNRESADISIVDFISYILNETKEKKLGSIFDQGECANHRYFMLGATNITNPYYRLAYVDQCGYLDDEKAPFGADFAFLVRGGDSASLPIVFDVKNLIKSIIEPFGVTFDERQLPEDLTDRTVGISFPAIPLSAAPKDTDASIISGIGSFIGLTYPNGGVNQSHQDMLDKYSNYMRMTCSKINISGLDWTMSGAYDIPNGGTDVGASVAISTLRSKVKTQLMLRPSKISIVNSGNYGFERNVIKGSNNELHIPITEYDESGLELWCYMMDRSGSISTRYKVCDLINDSYGNLSVGTMSDDYLYSDMFSIDVTDYFCITLAIHSNKTFAFGDKITMFGDQLKTTKDDDPFCSLVYNGAINVEFVLEYGKEDKERANELLFSSLTVSEKAVFVEGTYPDLNGVLSSYPKGRICDMKATLDNFEWYCYDFLLDFFQRFNYKMTSDGKSVFISPIQGQSNSDIDYVIDVSKYIDSQLVSNPADTDSEIKSFQVKNASLGLFQDKFFDGDLFGDSGKIILNNEKKEEKTVTLKSSIIPFIAGGSRITSASSDVAEVLYKYNSTAMLGIGNYEKASYGDTGVRYGYITGERKVLPLLSCSIGNGSIGYPDIDIAYYPTVGVFLNTYTRELYDADIYGRTNMYIHNNGTPCGELLYKITGGILFVHQFMFTTDPSSISSIEFYTPAEIKDRGVKPRPIGQEKVYRYSGNGVEQLADCSCGHNGVDKISVNTKYHNFNQNLMVCIPLGVGASSQRVSAVGVLNPKFPTSKVDMSVTLSEFLPAVKTGDHTDTLSFGVRGIPNTGSITTAYDRYFKSYEDSILNPKGTNTEMELYLTQEDTRRIIRGAGFNLYGQLYSLVDASDLSFNSEGDICKLKIAKRK